MLSMAHKIVTEGGGQLFVSFTFQPDEALGDDGDRQGGGGEGAPDAATGGARDASAEPDAAGSASGY